MCGIFGLITEKERAIGKELTEGGKRLAYRGYDSVGCATISKGEIDLRKDIGKIEEVSEKLNFAEMQGNRGLIQLRWATFGAPSKTNAQPHFDCDNDIVGAHNGNVVNTTQLREQFIKEGHEVRSTNDGEICIHAVERYLDKGDSMVESIRKAYKDLKGDYSLMIFHKGDDTLYAIKKGSSLAVGINNKEMYCSSDIPSLLPLTNKILQIKDGEIVVLKPNKYELISVETGEKVEREPEVFEEEMEAAKKGGYPHFMLKEMQEQAKVAGELIRLLHDSKYVDKFLNVVKNAKKVFFVGSGSSYHSCLLGSYYFNKIANIEAVPAVPQQFTEQYGNSLDKDTAIIFVSQSGETKDVITALEYAKEKNAHILGVMNVIGSTLMNMSEVYLPLACGYEVSVPATKTFTNQVIMFLYLAKKIAGEDCKDLDKLPDLLEKSFEQSENKCKEIAKQIENWKELYYLGYGVTYGSALEGALKLKEISYLHCEGIFSSEFKHGPLSAVTKDYPVFFITAPQDTDIMISHINEVTCREGRAIVIAEKNDNLAKNSTEYIELPKSDYYVNPILAIIPLQLIAYFTSVSKGINPDFPRNLSKTLTVD